MNGAAGMEGAQGSARKVSLIELRDFVGPPASFWALYLERVVDAVGAEAAWVLVRSQRHPWQVALSHGLGPGQDPQFAAELLQSAQRALTGKLSSSVRDDGGELIACVLPVSPDPLSHQAVFVAWFVAPQDQARHLLTSVMPLIVSIPEDYVQGQVRRYAGSDGQAMERSARRLYDVLDFAQRLSGQKRFVQLAMMLCNELATRFQAERVSLGWVYQTRVKLKAVSHVEHFDRKSNASRDLIASMEECLDQQMAVSFPCADPDAAGIRRAHEAFVRLHGIGSVTTVPLWLGDEIIAIVSIERSAGQLSRIENWEAGLLSRVVARVAQEVHSNDRWWGVRLKDSIFRSVGSWIGPRHVGMKLSFVSSAVCAALLFLLPWTYRVEALATLKSEEMVFVPAPFDGYLSQVHARVGDTVKIGQMLLELETGDLVLEAKVARAESVRHQRELERAQGTKDLSAAQIALARYQQALARLAQVEHQLDKARVVAPFSGVVVEGDLQQNLGTPVRRGDLMFKLARLNEVRLELTIPESDAHFVTANQSGEVAFVGRPDLRFPIRLENVEPVTALTKGQSVVRAHARFIEEPAPWWRPGMGGTAKIEIGERPLWWVLAHKSINRLREVFWL